MNAAVSCCFMRVMEPNVPAHRRRGNDVRLSIETRSRRSVQPACSAVISWRIGEWDRHERLERCGTCKSVTKCSCRLKFKAYASTRKLVNKPPVIVVWQLAVVDGVNRKTVIARPHALPSQDSLNLVLARASREKLCHGIGSLLERSIV